MKTLDRFIAKSYLGPMVLTFFIVLFVLLLQFLWLFIDELIGKGLSIGVIMEFMFWGMATFVPLALPLSTMLASIMTMGSLGENNELLAMKAAGIPLQRIMRPLMILVFAISVSAFFVSNNLIPYANLQISSLLYDIRQKREEVKIPAGIFYNGIDDISLYVNKQDEKTGLMHGIMLYDHRTKKGNTTVTVAESGYIRLTQNKKHILFSLYNGYTYEEGEKKIRDTTTSFQRRQFADQEVLVSLEGYDFTRSNSERFKDDAQVLSLSQLSQMNDSLSAILTETKQQFSNTLLSNNTIPNYQELDSASRETYAYTTDYDSLFNSKPAAKQLAAAEEATYRVENTLAQVTNYMANQERNDYPLRRVRIEWQRKFTLSFACLIFFFIGAPLGAIIRKGGLGMPVVVSIFFFIIYWVIDISGKRLARDGALDPLFGTWLSTLVLLPIGIFLTYKATTDSSLFNADKYLSFFKNIFSKRKKTINE